MVLTYSGLQSGQHYFTEKLSGSVVYRSDSASDERSLGYLSVGYYGPDQQFIVIGTSNLQNGEFIEYPDPTIEYHFRIWVDKWIASPVTVEVWSLSEWGLPHSTSEGGDRAALIEFLPLPSGEGIAIAPGLAVFTAGDTTFSLPAEDQPDYLQQYAVRGEAFWGIGARSLESYSSGRFSFVSGTGRSMLGLVRHFPEVDFQVLDWAWYVHSPEQVFAFEREPGQSIRSKGAHPWSPDKALSLAIVNGAVQFGIGGSVVYESPIPVTDPVYFAAVLGPQAFVVNCLREA